LLHTPNREYAVAVGRWLSEDPIMFRAGDANLYRYVGNSPTNATLADNPVIQNIKYLIAQAQTRVESADADLRAAQAKLARAQSALALTEQAIATARIKVEELNIEGKNRVAYDEEHGLDPEKDPRVRQLLVDIRDARQIITTSGDIRRRQQHEVNELRATVVVLQNTKAMAQNDVAFYQFMLMQVMQTIFDLKYKKPVTSGGK
jgi:hypothetical protein